eukprot:1209403-Prymnesium_polylepis.1
MKWVSISNERGQLQPSERDHNQCIRSSVNPAPSQTGLTSRWRKSASGWNPSCQTTVDTPHLDLQAVHADPRQPGASQALVEGCGPVGGAGRLQQRANVRRRGPTQGVQGFHQDQRPGLQARPDPDGRYNHKLEAWSRGYSCTTIFMRLVSMAYLLVQVYWSRAA